MDDDITTLKTRNKFIDPGAARVILSKFGGDVEKAITYTETLNNQLSGPRNDIYWGEPRGASRDVDIFLLHR